MRDRVGRELGGERGELVAVARIDPAELAAPESAARRDEVDPDDLGDLAALLEQLRDAGADLATHSRDQDPHADPPSKPSSMPDGSRHRSRPRASATGVDRRRADRADGRQGRLRSKMMRSPCRVSHGSWCWIVRENGMINSASPPVATTVHSPISPVNRSTIASIWPLKP